MQPFLFYSHYFTITSCLYDNDNDLFDVGAGMVLKGLRSIFFSSFSLIQWCAGPVLENQTRFHLMPNAT